MYARNQRGFGQFGDDTSPNPRRTMRIIPLYYWPEAHAKDAWTRKRRTRGELGRSVDDRYRGAGLAGNRPVINRPTDWGWRDSNFDDANCPNVSNSQSLTTPSENGSDPTLSQTLSAGPENVGLRHVVDAWPNLSDDARAAIRRIVDGA